MHPDDSERYSRQIRLPQLGVDGQQRLLDARVLIIGLGGLGSPAALYLAAAGVGHLVLSDFDRVEPSNLQRQIIHRQTDIGREKARSAADAIHALNPRTEVTALDWQLDADELAREVAAADCVLDCSDNFPTRFAINAACVAAGTPLVSGAAIRLEAQVTSFDPRREDGPCYRCLYDDDGSEGADCALEGVLAPVVGIAGSLQALEAVKLVAGIGEPLVGRLLALDAETLDLRVLRFARDATCPACSNRVRSLRTPPM
ncbi:MAG: molybdopterin-synthase adenylyltransferase MoeB [Chromatiales bacterium]|nr:molybdopterin-synthase adenylyltransferase MoeB [Chromatiales bacterium]